MGGARRPGGRQCGQGEGQGASHLQRGALGGEDEVGQLARRRRRARAVAVDRRLHGRRLGELVGHLDELGGREHPTLPASGTGTTAADVAHQRAKRRLRLRRLAEGGGDDDAVDVEGREAEHGAQRRLGARRAVREEAAREVRVALLHNSMRRGGVTPL